MPSVGKVKKCRKAMDRAYNLMRWYDITPDFYDNMRKKQKGKCAICGFKPKKHEKKLCVDHSHKSLKIRGLVCHWCNLGLARFKDSPSILIKAIMYLLSKPDYGKVKATRKTK